MDVVQVDELNEGTVSVAYCAVRVIIFAGIIIPRPAVSVVCAHFSKELNVAIPEHLWELEAQLQGLAAAKAVYRATLPLRQRRDKPHEIFLQYPQRQRHDDGVRRLKGTVHQRNLHTPLLLGVDGAHHRSCPHTCFREAFESFFKTPRERRHTFPQDVVLSGERRRSVILNCAELLELRDLVLHDLPVEVPREHLPLPLPPRQREARVPPYNAAVRLFEGLLQVHILPQAVPVGHDNLAHRLVPLRLDAVELRVPKPTALRVEHGDGVVVDAHDVLAALCRQCRDGVPLHAVDKRRADLNDATALNVAVCGVRDGVDATANGVLCLQQQHVVA
eukprot:PhM_4_TR16468/c0_g1_i1/m.65075